VGDVLYGSKAPFGPPALLPRDRVIALHARRLTFLHPIRYQPITVEAPLPGTWRELDLPEELPCASSPSST
jgi:23S rRNA pseudouridine1911/1915/1917 synthase